MTTKPVWRRVPFDGTELPARAVNALREVGITTVHQLRQQSEVELLRIPMLGRDTVAIIQEVLQELERHEEAAAAAEGAPREGRVCGTCGLWVERAPDRWGDCRWDAPVAYKDAKGTITAAWPPTRKLAWCGRWESKDGWHPGGADA